MHALLPKCNVDLSILLWDNRNLRVPVEMVVLSFVLPPPTPTATLKQSIMKLGKKSVET